VHARLVPLAGGGKPETDKTGCPLILKVQKTDEHGIGGGFFFHRPSLYPSILDLKKFIDNESFGKASRRRLPEGLNIILLQLWSVFGDEKAVSEDSHSQRDKRGGITC